MEPHAHGRSLDILVTHSPPALASTMAPTAHQGFAAFLADAHLRPRYLLHGHKHVYRQDEVTQTSHGHTTVINVYPWRIIEYEKMKDER